MSRTETDLFAQPSAAQVEQSRNVGRNYAEERGEGRRALEGQGRMRERRRSGQEQGQGREVALPGSRW